MSDARHFYDTLASEYDHFVNWSARLQVELPFLLRVLRRSGARSVLDVAGGTGQHALALAQAGYSASLADISSEMLRQAEKHASRVNLPLVTREAGFGELRAAFEERFDALICLGNSIPHVLDAAALERTLNDMAAVVAPGGVMIWQLRNYERVLAEQERFMAPQTGSSADKERLFVRFYDFEPPLVRFNMLLLEREPGAAWQQHIEQTLLYPWKRAELGLVLSSCGWEVQAVYGNLRGEPYVAATSSDLVLVARRC